MYDLLPQLVHGYYLFLADAPLMHMWRDSSVFNGWELGCYFEACDSGKTSQLFVLKANGPKAPVHP